LDSATGIPSIIFGVITVVFGGVTILVGMNQYRDTRARDAISPFLDLRLKFYADISNITATLAVTQDPEVYTRKCEEFWIYYWGSLALVEDIDVEHTMSNLGKYLKTRKFEDSRDKLEQLALNLAQTCRHSISKSWKLNNFIPKEQRLIESWNLLIRPSLENH